MKTETIDKELHILILEDVATDVELMEHELHKAGIPFSSVCVWTKEAFLKELEDRAPDIILADYSLPQFDGISALAIAKEKCPDVPFIIVSGAIGEELAVEALKSGATDCVLKHHLSRLEPSVCRALREVEERAERKRVEESLRKAHKELETRVKERTAELTKVNKELRVEITERKRAEEALQVSHRFLGITNRHTEMVSLLKEFVAEVKNLTRCSAAGFRVLDKEGNIPYLAYEGFSKRFHESESPLSIKTDQCMCVNVIKGYIYPELPFYTDGGSFYTNGTTRFLATVSEEEKGRTCNICNQFGYESVALVPICLEDRILGLIHIADPRENRVPLEMVEVLERAAMQLSTAIQRVQVEEALRTSAWEWRATFDTVTDAIALTDPEGRILRCNKAMSSFLGKPFSEITGRTCWGFMKHTSMDFDALCMHMRMHKTHRRESMIFPIGDKCFSVTVDPMLDGTNSLLGSVCIISDITERKKAEDELKQMADELARSNADLQQFAYAASHDLQEPLRGVEGFVKLMARRYKGELDAKADDFIDHIVEGVKRMQMLIKDLLEYSQVETEGKKFKSTDFSLALDKAVFNLQAAIEESGAVVTHDVLPTIMADASQISRLFQNMIGNAIKFHGKKTPKVHVSAERRGNEWVFSVRDNGIGIDPENAERIFVVFQRLHGREEYPGTGIGLAICKRIVERHSGRIWVESEPGRGSTFYFTIPFKELEQG